MINKTFRLFISSTFSDFITERSILNEEIFPEIDAYCQSQGYHFQLIDLRWGVNNESALNQNTLSICLDEVKRCRSLSPRPNFLLMAGERYGWIPLPAGISKPEFEGLLPFASDGERERICAWYLPDENAIGGEYVLKTRSGAFVSDEVWKQEEQRLHDALLACAGRSNALSEETLKRLTSSATEQEILEGLLTDDTVCGNAVALFRTGYPEKDPDQTKILALKKRIREKMSADGCVGNLFTLAWGRDYPAQFRQTITDALKANIAEEILRLEQESKTSDDGNRLLADLLPADGLIRRRSELLAIEQYVQGGTDAPLFVTGDSGSGKTTVLADYILHADHSGETVFSAFYGLDEASYTLVDCLKTMTGTIKQAYDISYNLDVSETNLAEGIHRLLQAVPEEKKTVLIIDGWDLFHDVGEIRESVFPARLPPHIKVIVSMATGEISRRFLTSGSHTLKIDRFTEEESDANLSRFLKQRGRQIVPDAQRAEISAVIRDGATPLLLKLLTEICARWRSADADPSLPDSTEEIALLHLNSMFDRFGHNRELVLYALALIANSPYGITEEELQSLLLKFPPVKAYFVSEDRYRHDLNKLPFVVWSRLFYDLKGCLTLTKINGNIVVKFAHAVFYRVFTRQYAAYCTAADAMLAEHYGAQASVFDASRPNTRKAVILPFLLKKKGDKRGLADLYEDLDFVNATVLVGNVDNTISDLWFLLASEGDVPHKNRLLSLFDCLQQNRDMLNCYYNEFFSCAAAAGIADVSDFPIERVQTGEDASGAFFPYSRNAGVEWNAADNKYAVYHRSYVCICNSVTGSELCRVFVESAKAGGQALVKRVLWISDSVIAVMVHEEGIRLYDVGNAIPNPIGEIRHADVAADKIRYSASHRLLFMQVGKRLTAFDPDTCLPVYGIPLHYKDALGIDLSEDELYVKERVGRIDVYDVQTGAFVKHIPVKRRHATPFNRFDLSDLRRVNGDRWLEMEQVTPTLALYDTAANTKTYLHPPFYRGWGDLLPGRKFLLIVRPEILVAIDLEENLSMKYYESANLQSASWVIEDQTLSLLTINGLRTVSLEAFTPFPPEVSRCLCLSGSAFYSVGYLGKALSGVLSLLSPLIRIFRNPRQYLRYAFLFSEAFEEVTAPLFFDREIRTGTLVEYAEDGKIAIAFEDRDTVFVYDADRTPLSVIDKLGLAVDNNLFKLRFSPDSRLLLLWCNLYVKVFDVAKGAELFTINLSKRPALDVLFEGSPAEVRLLLCDGKAYTVSVDRIRAGIKTLPKRVLKRDDLAERLPYWGPYTMFSEDGEPSVFPLLDVESFLQDLDDVATARAPHRWFQHANLYGSFRHLLFYCDGEFYLNADDSGIFAHPSVDFTKSQLIEQLHDASPLKCYLREKNDLQSTLYEFGDRYLVLISRLLNSIIAFDLNTMTVCAAHKVSGNIIGCRTVSGDVIEVLIDKAPYQLQFRINLYDD